MEQSDSNGTEQTKGSSGLLRGARRHLSSPTFLSALKPSGGLGTLFLPTWILYLVGALILAALIWGGVCQLRVWRWQKIMSSAKVRILDLEASKKIGAYQGVKQATTRAVQKIEAKDKALDQRLRDLAARQSSAKKRVDGMTAQELMEAFKHEGF